MYLLDTNIWLERLLDQENSEDVGRFLCETAVDKIYITDFTLHSIGVILTRFDKINIFSYFIIDLFLDSGVNLIRLEPHDLKKLELVVEIYGLDFDDAYQYIAAEKYDLILVSFDKDFDRTQRGRKSIDQLISL